MAKMLTYNNDGHYKKILICPLYVTKGKNTNNLRYADETTLMAESEEELKSLLMKVKEKSEKSVLKAWHSED